MNISFRKLEDSKKDFELLYKWCQNKFVYEWFEQRKLSLNEIEKKYRKKLESNQELFIMQVDNKDIGLLQLYPFEHDINVKGLDSFKNIYEFDIFIGEEEYLSKGIGTILVTKAKDLIYSNYNADSIILRPFKRNIRAIRCYQKNGFKIINEYNGTDTIGNPETMEILLNEKH